ncbi:MAG: hypothetical protein AAFV43_07195 [Planctomycetota bacterium]
MPADLLFAVALASVSVLAMVGLLSVGPLAQRATLLVAAGGFLLLGVGRLGLAGESLLWPYALVAASVVSGVTCRVVLGAGQRLVTDEQLFTGGESVRRADDRFTIGQLLAFMAATAGLCAAWAGMSLQRIEHVPLVGYSFFVATVVGVAGGVAAAAGVWLTLGQGEGSRRLLGAAAAVCAAAALVEGGVWVASAAGEQSRLWSLVASDDIENLRYVAWRPLLATAAAAATACTPLRLFGRRWQDWPFD